MGNNVRAMRLALNLSQEELAFRAGVDRTYVSQIERGVGNPSVRVLLKIAKILGVEVTGVDVNALLRVKSDRALMADLRRIAGRLFSRKIVRDKKAFTSDRQHGVILVDAETKGVIAGGDSARYMDLAEAKEELADMRISAGANQRDLQVISELFSRVIRPNLLFDRDATEGKKRETRDAVRPVYYQIKRGEMVVRVGERISPEQAVKLESGRYSVRITSIGSSRSARRAGMSVARALATTSTPPARAKEATSWACTS